MRVWDVTPCFLCRQHLLGEHREIHAIHSILSNHKSGYRSHPEVKRWVGRLDALKRRHDHVVWEMRLRGYKHNSDLHIVGDSTVQPEQLQTRKHQIELLNNKNCDCLRRPE